MAVRKIAVPLDRALVRRARLEDAGGAGKSDEQVLEDALMVFLGRRALEDARAQAPSARRRLNRFAVSEVKAVCPSRKHAA